MMSNYREQYIYQLKKENQVLWGELSEMARNSPEWKAVRKAIEANDTEISVMQDIIKRAKEQNEQVRINSELISSLI
jgi:CRISPR/Cas system CSM-associated protein Csm4 (group 5 of RAMP superfamily)